MSPVRWLGGALRLRVEGAAERFLNLCRGKDLAVWDIRRVDETALTCRMRPRALRVLRQQRRRHGCRITVLEKAGLPFALQAVRRRWTLPVAALLWACLLVLASTRVWAITVEGCETVEQRTVLDLVESCGFRVGVRRTGRAETEQIRHTVLQNCHKLSFFTINYRGSHAVIQVRERDDTEPDPDFLAPCDLVSDRAGIVDGIFPAEGTPEVREGDTVLPGTLLIRGTRTSAFGEVTPVHARGEVVLRTWPKVTVTLPKSVDFALPTGRETVRWSLVLGKKRINLYFIEKSPYLWYDKVIENRRLDLGNGYWLPVWLRRETYAEQERTSVPLSEEKIAALLEQRCTELLTAQPGREVVSATFRMEETEHAYVGILEAECRDSVGSERRPDAGKEE